MVIPRNEIETIILFCQVASQHGFTIISAQTHTFPDAIINRNGIDYRVEFEFESYNFWVHEHDPSNCDFIICWEDNLIDFMLPVLELSKPDWFNKEIVLMSHNEKMARYWQRRARLAEEKLNGIYNINVIRTESKRVINARIRKEKLANAIREQEECHILKMVTQREENDNFIRLVKDGVSRNKASEIAYGRRYAGDLVLRGKRILGEN